MKTIKVRYTYPLGNPVTFEYHSDKEEGFTRVELARKICAGYAKIYEEEGEAETIAPHLLNRAQSDGLYGIWGHDIENLMLHTVEQVEGNLFELGVDSKKASALCLL